jgi:hypothetical protein
MGNFIRASLAFIGMFTLLAGLLTLNAFHYAGLL